MSLKVFSSLGEAKRGRPRKNPAPEGHEGGEEHGPEGMEMKLRKASDYITLGKEAEKSGEKNAHPKTVAIQFGNGKTHDIPHEHIHHALKTIESWKGPGKNPDERMKKLADMDKSHEHFLHHIGKMPELKTPNKGSVKEEVEQVDEGSPELLKKEMPLHRHAEKLLAQNGVSKDDPDYHHHLNNTIKHLRQFGNINLINKSDEQGVAEGSPEFNARALRYAKANAAEKDREGRYSKKYPGGKEQHAKDTAAFMKRFPPPKNEEVEQVDENNDSHTHAAHFKNSKGEWAGMALIDAKSDADAVNKAHELSANDKWKDFKLDSVEKHVPVKEAVAHDSGWKKKEEHKDASGNVIKHVARSLAKKGMKAAEAESSSKPVKEEAMDTCKEHGKYEGKTCSKCKAMEEEKALSPKQKKIAALAGDPNKIDAEDLKVLRNMKDKKNAMKESVYTAANRYHAVESAVRAVMAQNRNLKEEAKLAEWNKNNPTRKKDK